eukprot:87885-Chlamydomonas_euryale.AAC.8
MWGGAAGSGGALGSGGAGRQPSMNAGAGGGGGGGGGGSTNGNASCGLSSASGAAGGAAAAVRSRGRLAKNNIPLSSIRVLFGRDVEFPIKCTVKLEIDGVMR